MRPMRRQDRAITDPAKILGVIDACPYCHLGFSDQGKPYVVPVNFGHALEEGRHVFYFHGAFEGRKIDLIRETGWACIQMEEGYRLNRSDRACGHSAAFRSVFAEGPVSFVEEPEAKRAALSLIMAHAAGSGDWAFPEAAVQGVCVCKLEARSLTCKGHL